MKRLVICCDGTWNRPDSEHVTNIEKIARTVQTDLAATDGVSQLVLYLSGVGAGYRVDRLLGGAFGFGLFSNVLAGYRFLASNYEPGDEIYVFGFSRGAYTARSLVGMVGAVGLLTRRALVAEKLPEAVALYQRKDPRGGKAGQSRAEFKRDYCHPDTPVRFLGVFDTVGALGVPGALRRSHQFHDVRLSDAVQCARQALAADECRMKFEPCLWESHDGEPEDPRVRQVWFEGAHSDVGGGYADTGLSDTALLWMVAEANRQGLAFDEELLATYLTSGSSAVRHDSMTPLFWLLDLVIRTKIRLGRVGGASFLGRQRRLHRTDSVSVRIAAPCAQHFREDSGYRPRNLQELWDATDDFAGCLEEAFALPPATPDELARFLSDRQVRLGRGGAPPRQEGPPGAATLPPQERRVAVEPDPRPAPNPW